MNFSVTYNALLNQQSNDTAWHLLRRDNAPMVFAFIQQCFNGENAISRPQAIARLQAALDDLLRNGQIDSHTPANIYLNQWVNYGYFREYDDAYHKTDACELALRFAQGLEDRVSYTTASHLKVVQDAVKELTIELNPNVDERIDYLQAKQSETETEINKLKRGEVALLTPKQTKERLLNVFNLASVLSQDFAKIDEDYNRLYHDMLKQITKTQHTRTSLLRAYLDERNIVAQSDSGLTLDAFYDLLRDNDTRAGFQTQLNYLISVAKKHENALSLRQQRDLKTLLATLNRETKRLNETKRSMHKKLDDYVHSPEILEHNRLELGLTQALALALELTENDVPLKTELPLFLTNPKPNIGKPCVSITLPELPYDTGQIVTHVAKSDLDTEMFSGMRSQSLRDLFDEISAIIAQQDTPLSLSKLLEHRPITGGVGEFTNFIRISNAVDALIVNERKAKHLVQQYDGTQLLITSPEILFLPGSFKEEAYNRL